MLEVPVGMKQVAVVVGGEGIDIEAFVVEERKDATKKVIVENSNAYVFAPAPK